MSVIIYLLDKYFQTSAGVFPFFSMQVRYGVHAICAVNKGRDAS